MTDLTRKYRNRLKEAQGLMPSDEAYLKSPEDCPSCGSTKGKRIWDSHWESISPTRGFIQAQCRGCGATWEDHYELIGYERLEEERDGT